MLRLLKTLFFIFITPSRSLSLVRKIWEKHYNKKNIGKWSEKSDLIIPYFRELLKVSVVKMLSIRLTESSEIHVGRFIIRIYNYFHEELCPKSYRGGRSAWYTIN